MLFKHELSIPKDTLKAVPLIETMKITRGVIKQWDIFIPEGVDAVAGIMILYNSNPLLPTNDTFWVTGNNFHLSVPDFNYINVPPYELNIHGYNTSENYTHTLTVYVTILPFWALTNESSQFQELLFQNEVIK